MLESINGLPLHPLVVHAAVVLTPLTCVGTLLIAVRPKWRKALGWWVLGLAALSLVATYASKQSGESLAGAVGTPIPHAELGESVPLLVAAMFVSVAAFVVTAFEVNRNSAQEEGVLLSILAIIAVVVSIAATVQTVRVGESGAQAVWSDVSG